MTYIYQGVYTNAAVELGKALDPPRVPRVVNYPGRCTCPYLANTYDIDSQGMFKDHLLGLEYGQKINRQI